MARNDEPHVDLPTEFNSKLFARFLSPTEVFLEICGVPEPVLAPDKAEDQPGARPCRQTESAQAHMRFYAHYVGIPTIYSWLELDFRWSPPLFRMLR